jgi:hypothetical protein
VLGRAPEERLCAVLNDRLTSVRVRTSVRDGAQASLVYRCPQSESEKIEDWLSSLLHETF